jgi:hypothetical protein
MKRLVPLFMVIAVLLSMTACTGIAPSTPSPTTTPTPSPVTMPAPAEPSTQPTTSPAPVSGAMQAYFFDVGQADASLLLGSDFAVLIDAGDYTRNDVVPYLKSVGVEEIDLLIGTHPHADHIGQIPQILENFTVQEVWLSGDTHTSNTFERALNDAIAKGEEVEFELNVQLMDIADELKQDFDPLDPTKTWPESNFPLMPVGKMVLNRNPENFFTEVEQAAFCPATIVPGIEFSADKLLQGRTFSYADTQRHRLGTNYLQLGVNRPIVPVNNNQRDGAMQIGQFSGPVNYEPNSLAGGMPEEAHEEGKSRVYQLDGEVTRRKISLTNDFAQAGERYHSLSKMDQEHLIDNLIADLTHIDKPIQKRVIDNLTKADSALGCSVAMGLKL